MRRKSLGAVLAVACLGLTACASTGGSRAAQDQSGFSDEIDYQKVISVNEWAHTHGARVMWVNYPQKSRFDKDGG